MSSDRHQASSIEATTPGTGTLEEARFIPQRYEPNYAYPLLVLFHSRGGDEQQMMHAMPAMSWRNHVGLSLRGPDPFPRRDGMEGYAWGPEFARPNRIAAPPPLPALSEGEQFRRMHWNANSDPIARLEDGVFSSIRQTRRALHIHSERIFLIGYGEGAAVAYRLGLSYPERIAGVVAINGWLPGGFRPLGRLKACRDLRILVVHGEWNARVSIRNARREVAMLRAGGLRVAFQSYPCAHRITSPMLSDVDTWLINLCTSQD